MCGIAGIFALDSRSFPKETLPRMNAVMVHRGPDEGGIFCDNRAGLAMRRLSIIGLGNGHQPIFSEDEDLALILNGEIYNHRDLRKSLERGGHRFATDSDAEVAVHLYEELGNAFVDELRGMFALALYDRRRQALVLARDRAGKKPLYYAVYAGLIVFGSEIKAIHASGLVPKQLDPHAVDSYLSQGFVAGQDTLFEGVSKVPAGCMLTVAGGDVAVKRYWDLPRAAEAATSLDAAAQRVRSLLEEAVSVRLMSEVPLGAFLSGGIDSSAIVGIMSRQLGAPVQTFAVGFDDAGLDEVHHARDVAREFGTEHHEILVRDCDADLLREINWHNDEPAADPAAVPTFCLSKLARQHVTVVLTGEGGDEMFAGYRHYRLHQQLLAMERRIPGLALAARSADHLAPYLGRIGSRRLWKGLWVAGMPGDERYRGWLSAFTDAELARLYNDDFRRSYKNGHQTAAFRTYTERAADLDPLGRALYVDSKLHLADQLLMKVDKMTMAASLEARCPFLDQKLLEYVATLPADLKASPRGSKLVLRRALQGLVPDRVLARPKQGFDPPVRRWLLADLAPLAHELLLQPAAAIGAYLDLSAVRELWGSLQRRKDDQLARQCWILLNFAQWHELHWPDSQRLAACQ